MTSRGIPASGNPAELPHTTTHARFPTLLGALQALPAQTNVDYAPSARKVLEHVEATPENLRAIAKDSTLPSGTRFNAFYCMQAREWRLKNYTRHRANTDEFQSSFSDQPMLNFMQAEYYSVADHELPNLETALIFAKQACEQLPAVPGILHLYAELVCSYVERAKVERPDLLAEADRSVARAIALDGKYPKYFATRAVVSMLRGAFDDAIQQVSIAIDREDSAGPHYALRVGDYQLIRSRINYEVEYRQLKSSQEEAVQEFRQMRSQVLAVLGLLAAVIALIASSTNMAARADMATAAPLLLVSGSVVLVIFWGFHFLFVSEKRSFQNYIPLIVGIILGSIGFVWSQFH